MRVLVMGVAGLLGSNVYREGRLRGVGVIGTYKSTAPSTSGSFETLDIRDVERFESLLDVHDPDVVINCAAMTDVDGCEDNPESAHEINGQAPGRMASACADRGIEFVQISTDYVFDGAANSPYDEAAATDPIQEYGRSKLAGERTVLDAHPGALVLRVSFLFGRHGFTKDLVGFPDWLRETLRVDGEAWLFSDQHVTPTRAGYASEAIFDLLDAGADGVIHLGGGSCISPLEFGTEFTDAFGLVGSLYESSLSDVDRPAERPRYSCLTSTRRRQYLDVTPPTIEEDIESIKSPTEN